MMAWLIDLGPQLQSVAVATSWCVIAAGVLQNGLYIVQLILAYVSLRRRPPEPDDAAIWAGVSDVTMPIALLVPAYNEQETIVESVRSLLALHYPNFEVIVVNDGSQDATLARLVEGFDLKPVERAYESAAPHKPVRALYGSARYRHLLVVDKENGGKADALNAGIDLSRAPLFCAVDADSILENDALLRAVQPFVDDPARTVAVGGTVRVANGCTIVAGRVTEVGLPRRLLPLFQTIEYLRAYLIARLAWSSLGALTLISGAFGIFRRQAAVAVGGYSLGTVGEDFELIVKLHRRMREADADYVIRFVPEPVCWTEAPETVRVLARQRIRWQRGALETFFWHWRMLLHPRYGRVGALGFSHMLVVDVLGPPLEAFGYLLIPSLWAIDAISLPFLLAFIALTFTFGVFISVGSLVLEELELRRVPGWKPLFILTMVAVLENFGYRQLNNLWRIVGYWQFLRRQEGGWGVMTRIGFSRR